MGIKAHCEASGSAIQNATKFLATGTGGKCAGEGWVANERLLCWRSGLLESVLLFSEDVRVTLFNVVLPA